VDWNEKYSVGDALIDNEHKVIFDLINQIEGADSLGEITTFIASTLESYVSEHFHHEEFYMAKIGYPDLEEHRQHHEEFAAKAVQMIDELGGGNSVQQMEVKTYLQNWLQNHILEEDMKFRDWVLSQK